VPPATPLRGKECPYYPCHDLADMDCEYCYCPLYDLGDKCGGNYVILSNGIKDCSHCNRPHTAEGKLDIQQMIH
jgi:Zn-finger protein